MRILFFGSDVASLISLRILNNAFGRGSQSILKPISRLDVVAPVAKLFGKGTKRQLRSNPVRDFAEHNNLAVFDAPRSRDTAWGLELDRIRGNYDLGVVVSFGYFLPEELISAFPYGAINVHPSILPEYRGASPIQHCLMNGDLKSGCSIIDVDPNGWDTGCILRQDIVDVSTTETYSILSKRLLELGANQLLDVITDFDAYKQKKFPQPDLPGCTRAPKLNPVKHGLIDFQTFSSTKVWNHWRALSSSCGIYGLLAAGSKRKRILHVCFNEVSLANEEDVTRAVGGGAFGDLLVDKESGRLFVLCEDGKPIELTRLTIAGRKKAMDAGAFINGYCKAEQSSWPKFRVGT